MIEIFEKHETAILLNRRIVDKINDLSADYSLAQDEYEEIRTRHQQAYVHERQVFIEFLDSLGEKEKGQLIKQALLLHALGIEKQHLQQLFEYNEIDEPLYIYLNTKLERQIVRVEQ